MAILILPLAVSDRNHVEAFVRLMTAFGPYLEDRALILPTPSAMADPVLRKAADDLRSLFDPELCRLEETPNDFGATWPYAPGCHFKHAMERLDQLGWSDTSIWMESDLMPIKPGWLQAVKEDYHMAATPFRGMLEKTRYIDITPGGQRSPRFDGSVHLVGAGMYPKDYLQFRCPVNGSPMASFRSPSDFIPFDVKCQFQHLPATQSPLWLHAPRTVKWMRLATGSMKLSCENRERDEFGLSYAGAYDLSEICLIHGCKDSSLADSILGGGAAHSAPVVRDGVGRVDVVSAPPAQDLDGSILDEDGVNVAMRDSILVDRIHDLEAENQELRNQNAVLERRILEMSHLPSTSYPEPDDQVQLPEPASTDPAPPVNSPHARGDGPRRGRPPMKGKKPPHTRGDKPKPVKRPVAA